MSKSEVSDLKLQFHFAFCILQVAFFKICRWQKHTFPNAFTKSNCNPDMSANLKSACTYQPGLLSTCLSNACSRMIGDLCKFSPPRCILARTFVERALCVLAKCNHISLLLYSCMWCSVITACCGKWFIWLTCFELVCGNGHLSGPNQSQEWFHSRFQIKLDSACIVTLSCATWNTVNTGAHGPVA